MFPTNRQEFTDKCLRALGHPVIEINVDEDQVGDRVDDALARYWEFHHDGVERIYMKHQVTADDIANTAIPMNDMIVGVVRVFPFHGGSALTSSLSMFDVRYQWQMSQLSEFTSLSYVDYEITMMHLEQLSFFFTGKPGCRFNKAQNKLFLDVDWNYNIAVDDWIVIECYRILDPDTYADIWKDGWLFRYATQLIKRQWGANMSKFTNVPLMGGVMMDGKTIYLEADQEVKNLELELRDVYEEPPRFLLG